MTLDPRWSVFLSLALGIATVFVGIPDWTDSGIDPATVKHLIWWGAAFIGVGNFVNAALGAIPSKSDPASLKAFWLGPKVQPQPK